MLRTKHGTLTILPDGKMMQIPGMHVVHGTADGAAAALCCSMCSDTRMRSTTVISITHEHNQMSFI